MTNSPIFSIIIPTYNRAELLKRCLDSVVSQTFTDWEAIVVDNYSEDNTEEIVLSYNDDRIRYLKNYNYGVIAVSRNKALDLANGNYICFLDSDDSWVPNKLEIILPYMKEYDLVYHNYIKNYNDGVKDRHPNSNFYEIKECTVNYVIQRGDPINPSCSCVRSNAIGSTRFDESKDLFAVEDYDFFLQLINRSIKIKFLSDALTYYDMSGCSHNEKAADRDLFIFEKWKHLLNDIEQHEFMCLNAYRRACYFMQMNQYQKANVFYREALNANLKINKFKASKGFIKSMIYKVIKGKLL